MLWAKLIAALASAATVLLSLFGIYKKGESSGVNQQKVKEAEDRGKNLEDVRKAQDAAAAVRPNDGGMSDDPHNRDNWRT